jgi:hypothetical protein
VSRSTSGKIDTSSTSPRPISRTSTWTGQDRSARASPAAYRPARAASPATPPAASTRFHGIAAPSSMTGVKARAHHGVTIADTGVQQPGPAAAGPGS